MNGCEADPVALVRWRAGGCRSDPDPEAQPVVCAAGSTQKSTRAFTQGRPPSWLQERSAVLISALPIRAALISAVLISAVMAPFSVCTAQSVVRGAPFCAEAVHGSQQWLADGNRVSTQNRSRTCRDAEGRVRQEFERGPRAWVFLRDPTLREVWLLDPERRVARRLNPQRPHPFALDRDQRDTAEAMLRHGIEQRGAGDRGDLGSRLHEGLLLVGELTTWTIEPGRMGNEKPMVITREVWRSPELSIPISIQDRDPRFGERYLQVFNIRRQEPDPELMRVPADFARQDPDARGRRLMPP